MISNPMNHILLYPFSNLVSIYFEQQSKDGISYNLVSFNHYTSNINMYLLKLSHKEKKRKKKKKRSNCIHPWIIRKGVLRSTSFITFIFRKYTI